MRHFSRICALGLFVFLTACAGADAPTEATSSEPTVTFTSPAIVAKATPAIEVEPEINAPAPSDLIGILPVDLSKEIGNASLVRRDLGTEIWQYRGDNCVLFFFLYSKSDASHPGDMRVRHFDVRGEQDAASCLKNIVRKRTLSSQG